MKLTNFIFSSFALGTFNIFIDSGGSPDAYLTSDINNFLNDTTYFNETLIDNNGTDFGTRILDRNKTHGNVTSDENVGELVVMAITSIVLGLMILITVIGKFSIEISRLDQTPDDYQSAILYHRVIDREYH